MEVTKRKIICRYSEGASLYDAMKRMVIFKLQNRNIKIETMIKK